MKTELTIKQIDQILEFINQWQENNPYNPPYSEKRLQEFNAKFRKGIQVFFEQSNLKTITVNEIIKSIII